MFPRLKGAIYENSPKGEPVNQIMFEKNPEKLNIGDDGRREEQLALEPEEQQQEVPGGEVHRQVPGGPDDAEERNQEQEGRQHGLRGVQQD